MAERTAEQEIEYFNQPVDGIRVVRRARGPRTLLTPEALEAARARVAAGEDIDAVAESLAIERVALEIKAR